MSVLKTCPSCNGSKIKIETEVIDFDQKTGEVTKTKEHIRECTQCSGSGCVPEWET